MDVSHEKKKLALHKKYGHTQLEITYPNHYQTPLHDYFKYVFLSVKKSTWMFRMFRLDVSIAHARVSKQGHITDRLATDLPKYNIPFTV